MSFKTIHIFLLCLEITEFGYSQSGFQYLNSLKFNTYIYEENESMEKWVREIARKSEKKLSEKNSILEGIIMVLNI